MKMEITPDIDLDEKEYTLQAFHASGPGGQNVNKVATAIRLRYNIPASSLPEPVKHRLNRIARNRVSQAGDLILTSQRFRTQEQNRGAAVQQLVDLILQAATPPRKRKATRPTRGSIERRLEAKRRRGAKKKNRQADFLD